MKYNQISEKSNDEILKILKTSEEGLNQNEVEKRIEENGLNIATNVKKKGPLYFLIQSFKDKFIVILLILAVIDYMTNDTIGTIIIIILAIASALLRFSQDYSTYRFNEKLRAKIKLTANVIRKGKTKEILQERVVIGDIVTLSAGSVVPADLVLIESKDLFLNQSAFTGESLPVEKIANRKEDQNESDIFNIPNICLMGSSVISGNATGVVITTGLNTYMGNMNKDIEKRREPTNFDKGMDKITKMLIKYMIIISVAVFIIYGFIRKDLTEALLFALSVAVGITPSMLPMIVNVNLTKGSKTLAKKKTLVKNIQSIQNLGSMDILCTDKTGTLTMNNIVLQKYLNVDGKDDENVLKCAFLNSSLGTGLKNLVDRAVITYGKEHKIDIKEDIKVDEIPFDYMRKRMSIVIKENDEHTMITKGALEEIIKICDTALIEGKKVALTKEIIDKVNNKAEELAKSGMQVISLAIKNEYPGVTKFSEKDESRMTLIGIIAFLDPPKKDAKITIEKLSEMGVTTKILTGDNQYATQSVCNIVGIKSKILLGKEIENMSDKKLETVVENVDVFARMNPMQKERVVKALKNNGHIVGYMGDGVNDAPSLHISDVGISVNSGTDIAKESSDIILLEQSLEVIYNGVIEGRKVYGNIIKYMKLALSSDFGDVFSIMIASIFLPFLPLLPIQMLIQDFLFEISQIGIPYDTVDPEFIQKPRKWDTKDLGKFMRIMGVISSITDIAAFIIFWFIFKYNTVEKQAWFQTAWFVECLISETLIIHYIRTDKVPFIQSKPSKTLFLMTLITIIATVLTPIIFNNVADFNFVILPAKYYGYLIALVVTYAIIVQIVKKIYIKKYKGWL